MKTWVIKSTQPEVQMIYLIKEKSPGGSELLLLGGPLLAGTVRPRPDTKELRSSRRLRCIDARRPGDGASGGSDTSSMSCMHAQRL